MFVHCQGSGRQEVELAERPGGPRPRRHALERREGAGARLRHVGVGIGPVGDQRVRRGDHVRGDVGVKVEAGDEGNRADGFADAREQRALAVFEMFADHRAMEIEIQGVEGARGGDVVEQHRDDALEGVALSTRAEGSAAAQRSGAARWPAASAASRKPATGRLIPATAGASAAPRDSGGQPPARAKSSNRAGVGAKVLVSCWNPPTPIRIPQCSPMNPPLSTAGRSPVRA